MATLLDSLTDDGVFSVEPSSTSSTLTANSQPVAPAPTEPVLAAFLRAARRGDVAFLRAELARDAALAKERASSAEELYPWATALMVAAFYGQAECVALLLPHSDPAARDVQGATALMHAAFAGEAQCLELLLPVSDALAVDEWGRPALFHAVSGNPAVELRCGLLYWRDGFSQSESWNPDQPRTRAQERRHERNRARCVRLLGQAAPSVLRQAFERVELKDQTVKQWHYSFYADTTPLIESARRASPHCLRAMLGMVPAEDLWTRDQGGDTPLMASARSWSEGATTRVLLSHGALDRQDAQGALWQAAGYFGESFKALWPHANLQTADAEGHTPLMAAARMDCAASVGAALAQSTVQDRERVDVDGWNALAHAANADLECRMFSSNGRGEAFEPLLLNASAQERDVALKAVAPRAESLWRDAQAPGIKIFDINAEGIAELLDSLAFGTSSASEALVTSLIATMGPGSLPRSPRRLEALAIAEAAGLTAGSDENPAAAAPQDGAHARERARRL